MPSTKVPVLLALLVAALCTANLPAADAGATKTHRKMLGVGMPQMPEMPTGKHVMGMTWKMLGSSQTTYT